MKMDSFQFQSLVSKDLLAEIQILHVCLYYDCSFFSFPLFNFFWEVLSTSKGRAGSF